jgi:serine/threonine protein phosphatase PrpC
MLVSSNWMEAVPREVAKEDSLPLTRPNAAQIEGRAPVLDIHGITDVGLVRERNEDQFLVAQLYRQMVIEQSSLPVASDRRVLLGDTGQLLIVADGVGGHGAGDLASAVAVDAVADAVLRSTPWVFEPGLVPDEPERDAQVANELQAALARAEAQVHAVGERHQSQRMATTLTLGLLLWPRLYVAHAGDSRCYIVRDGRLRRVTRDHTLGEQVGAQNGAFKHVLVNAVGGSEEKLMVEIHRVMLEVGDGILFCTDGLTNQVTDEEITAHFNEGGGAREICQSLVEHAKATGARDNVTAVVALALRSSH